ncbi:S8 family peptidase [Pontimicrobium sp. MEBiC01747]
MKNLIKLLVCCAFILLGCSEIEDDTITNDTASTQILEKGLKPNLSYNNINMAKYHNNELIIQYKKNVSPAAIKLFRQSFGIYSANLQGTPPPNKQGTFKVCDLCSPEAIIELWTLEPEVDIEIVAIGISGDDDTDSEDLIDAFSYNLSFVLENDTTPAFGSIEYADYTDKVVTENTGVTIAVIDSGLNPNFPVFNGQPFLYKANLPGFPSVISGWDFVNSDNDPFDDNLVQHGSLVTSVLKTKLDLTDTDYQIIPLKASNDEGRSSLFNIICAVNAAGNMGAKVINISSGYYQSPVLTSPIGATLTNDQILTNLFKQFNNTLVVTSAGNANNNNDNEKIHKPSSISEPNLLAIGAARYYAKNTDVRIASFSNHGIYSVDYVARGYNVSFIDVGNNQHFIHGTSFAAPQVSAVAATILDNYDYSLTITQLMEKIYNYGQYLTYYESDRQVKFQKVIP